MSVARCDGCGAEIEFKDVPVRVRAGVRVPAGSEPATRRVPFDTDTFGQRHSCQPYRPATRRMATPEELTRIRAGLPLYERT